MCERYDAELQITDVGYLIKQISDKMRANANANFREHGLTFSQVHVLDFIKACGGEVAQKDIEIYLNVSHPTIVGLVSRLEKAGFVSCRVDERCRRNKIVCETEKARAVAKKMDKSRVELERRLCNTLGQRDREELTRLLTLVYQNL